MDDDAYSLLVLKYSSAKGNSTALGKTPQTNKILFHSNFLCILLKS